MNTKLYVGDLSVNTGEAQLRELFSQAGHVRAVSRSVDRATKLLRNFAFVEMGTAEEAAKAIELLNGHEVDGRIIKVSEARAQEHEHGAARNGFEHAGGGFGHHRQDTFTRGNNRSGFGRGSGHRGRG